MQRDLHSCFFCYRLVIVHATNLQERKRQPSNIYHIGLMKNITKYLAPVTTILLIVGLAGPANAVIPTPTEVSKTVQPAERNYQPVVSSVSAPIHFESPVIKSVAAPIPEPEPVVQNTQSVRTTASTPAVKPYTAPKTASQPPAAVSVTQTPVAASGKGAALLASARSQIGQIQDCTRMVERALGSIGIISGDLAPAQFFRFGPTVSSPQPGDIIISSGHVGIYSGNGMMVSGGFNGSQTVEHPISYVGGYSVVRVA